MNLTEHIAKSCEDPLFRKDWFHIQVGELILDERMNRNMTQNEFSRKLGMMQPTLSNLECGRPTTVETLRQIAEKLDLDLEIKFVTKLK